MSINSADLYALRADLSQLAVPDIPEADAAAAEERIASTITAIETSDERWNVCGALSQADGRGELAPWIAHMYQRQSAHPELPTLPDETRAPMWKALAADAGNYCFVLDSVYRHLDHNYPAAAPHRSDREAVMKALPEPTEGIDGWRVQRSRDELGAVSAYEAQHPGLFSSHLKDAFARKPAEVLEFFKQLPNEGGYVNEFARELEHHAHTILDRWTPAELAAVEIALSQKVANMHGIFNGVMLKKSTDERVAFTRALVDEIGKLPPDPEAYHLGWINSARDNQLEAISSWIALQKTDPPIAPAWAWSLEYAASLLKPSTLEASIVESMKLSRKDFTWMATNVHSEILGQSKLSYAAGTEIRTQLANAWKGLHPDDLDVYQSVTRGPDLD